MRKVLYIAFKDVRRTFRDIPALVTMLAAPLIIALVLGAAFGGSKGFSIPPTKVVVVNLDAAAPQASGDQVGDTIVATLKSPGLKEVLQVEQLTGEEEARSQVDNGDAAVALIIPRGLTAALTQSQHASTVPSASTAIVLYRDPTKTIGPGIVNSVIQRVVAQVNGAWAAAGATAQLAPSAGFTDPAVVTQLATTAATRFVSQAQSAPGLTVDAREPQVAAVEKTKVVGVAGPVLVGMMIFFMFLAASNAARSILDEDANGTLPRLFTTPTPRGVILAGKFLSVLLTVLIQAVVLIIAGRLIFGIDWGGPAPVGALIVVGAAVAAGFAVCLMSLARTPGQAGAITSGVFLVMALVGGNFVGTADPGGIFGTVRLFTPNGWLLKGWDSTLRGGSIGDVLLPVVVALAFALVTFSLGVVLFRRRFS